MITEIIAAGAMGVSVFFAIKAHSLLKDEQAKESPRPDFLRSIYVFMGFALLMTPVALGIEYARHQMNLDNTGNEQAGLTKILSDLESKGYFGLNKNGNPEAVTLEFNGENYALAKPLPGDALANAHLKLRKAEDGSYRVYKSNNGQEVAYGYFTAEDFNRDLKDLLVVVDNSPKEPADPLLESKKLMGTGLLYAPRTDALARVQRELGKSTIYKTTNRYLLDFADSTSTEDPLHGLAVDLLIDGNHLRALDSLKYDRLLSILSTDGSRDLPHRHYELAQVYFSRFTKYHQQQDQLAYIKYYCKYVKGYTAAKWLRNDPAKYKVELRWYNELTEELKPYRFDQDCNCTNLPSR